jgi:hypothetical protein
VLSNAYPILVDCLLTSGASDYAIYGDDFTIFDIDSARGRSVIQALDDLLASELPLKLNRAKTVEIFDSIAAADYIENNSRASIDVVDQVDDKTATAMLYKLWDDRVMSTPTRNMTEVHLANSSGRRNNSIRRSCDGKTKEALGPYRSGSAAVAGSTAGCST